MKRIIYVFWCVTFCSIQSMEAQVQLADGYTNARQAKQGFWTIEAMAGIAIPLQPSISGEYSTSYKGTYTVHRRPSAAPWLRISHMSRSLVKNSDHDLRIQTNLRLSSSSSYRETSYSGTLLPGAYDPVIPPLSETANIKEQAWSFSFMLESGVAYTITLPRLDLGFSLNTGLGLNSYYVSLQKGKYNDQFVTRRDNFFPNDIAPRGTESRWTEHLVYAVSVNLIIRPSALRGLYFVVNLPLWNDLMDDQTRSHVNCPCGTRDVPVFQPSIGLGYRIKRTTK